MGQREIVILGGGPAGLTAGVVLHRAGRQVRVVEKAPRVGGLTRTLERGGFRFDLGGHRFYSKNPRVHDFVADLLGDELIEVRRLSRIHFRDRFVDYPVRPLNALRHVGLWTSAKIARDLLRLAVTRRRPAPRSLQDWMLQSYGPTLFQTYFKVYAEKVWGLPADRIDAELAAQRVKGLDLWTTLRHAVLRRSPAAVESMVERFHYPRRGYGRICEAMAAELAPAGAVQVGVQPRRIAHRGGEVTRVELETPEGVYEVEVEQLVSSIPLPALVRSMDPPAPPAVRAACDGLAFRAVVFVALFLDRPTVRPESWIYFPSPAISFGRITEPRNWSPEMAPAGQTSIVAEHFCERGDGTWRRTDAELVRRTLADLTGKLGFFAPEEVLGAQVVRVPNAYPRMDVEHRGKVAQIERWLDTFANLQAVGRGGLFRYHNTDHVIETAFAAATNVLGGCADVRAVNSELTYHEEKRSA